MAEIIKSQSSTWIDISDQLYNEAKFGMNGLYNALDYAMQATDIVTEAGDIGELSISVLESEIETLNEKRRMLVSFANGIHYEISQLVDNLFSVELGKLAERVIALNPSDIEVNMGTSKVDTDCQSLMSLITYNIYDEGLKENFEAQVQSLDEDVIEYTLAQAIIEALFWEKEYQKAIECGEAADRIFTEEIKSNWGNMTSEERIEIINEYKDAIGIIFGEGINITTSDVKYDNEVQDGFGKSFGGYIAINPNFINDPTGNYSVDKLIDTITHEMRHEYQVYVIANPDLFEEPENVYYDWSLKYIPPRPEYEPYYHQPKEEDARSFAALARLGY